MRYLISIGLVLLFLTHALPIRAEQPKWSLALKGGYTFPDADGWENYYGGDGFWTFGVDIGRKINRQLELNASISYGNDSGKALTPSGEQSADDLDYSQLPIHISILYRFISDEDQFIIPYCGGGYTHLFYRLEFVDEDRSGDQFGFHVRGGFQILLDKLVIDDSIFHSLGIHNTYLFFEGIYSNVDDFGREEIDLGGWTVFIGLLFEF